MKQTNNKKMTVMVKNILYICLLAWAFCSCEQKDSFPYTEKAGLYFYVPDVKEGENENPDALKREIDFAFTYYQEFDEWGYPVVTYYYGDSLKVDTVRIVIALLGETSEQPRKYYLKTTPVEESENLPENIIFENPYIFPAGQYMDTIKIAITRPEKRGEYAIGITFDSEDPEGEFESNVAERNVFVCKLYNSYPRPYGWNDATSVFGEYSEEKYAFYVTILHTIYYDWHEQEWTGYKNQLKAALEAYNTAHPDNPKDFTFPGMN